MKTHYAAAPISLSLSASAATITVNTLDDTVAIHGAGSLREALDNAGNHHADLVHRGTGDAVVDTWEADDALCHGSQAAIVIDVAKAALVPRGGTLPISSSSVLRAPPVDHGMTTSDRGG
ncbi:hypothetical protein [Pseudofulvimonas gallinarii]|uniref:Uncharacterized protein n=1 Tax=Pseudofulvimonas gallinarii TaxID=634155 RepID=A0A4S3KYT1_9GAMM|nr:hypothetical protein [Pseudofulvimonas gallinarii]TCS94528.1 hypothetical protein EDC25_12147 [Pseudofulvimonas gallinarii]THD14567.1 hypothetical protein B1808_03220 [Pseudofulvimonas gallinarii]